MNKFSTKLTVIVSTLFLFSSSHATPPVNKKPGPKRVAPASALKAPPHASGHFLPKRGFGTRVETARTIRDRLNRLPEGSRPVDPITRFTAVNGTVSLPVMPFKYGNTGVDPYLARDLEDRLFTTDPSRKSVTTHYREMSRDLFTLTGEVFDWVELSEDDTYYEDKDDNTCSKNCDKNNGHAFLEALKVHDKSIDFRLFDNDGPDNIPDSADDDGFVDFPAFVHSENGGECGNSNIWSHKFYMSAWMGNQDGFETNDVSKTTGKKIMIDDYVVMPALNCDNVNMIDIGVFSHEFGHAFKLPDLYDTSQRSSGAGGWSLMASGSWGGRGFGNPESPTHMTAWSKQFLGWVWPQVIKKDTKNVTIRPYVETNDVVLIDYPDSVDPYDESYLLIEYRDNTRVGSRTSFDNTLTGFGLVVSEINNTRIRAGQNNNRVNYEPFDQGVNIIEADGNLDLNFGRNRADGGDVYPGSQNVTELSSQSYEPIKAAICNISQAQGSMSFDVYVSRSTCPENLAIPVSPIKSPAQSSEKDPFSEILHEMLKSNN